MRKVRRKKKNKCVTFSKWFLSTARSKNKKLYFVSLTSSNGVNIGKLSSIKVNCNMSVV